MYDFYKQEILTNVCSQIVFLTYFNGSIVNISLPAMEC